MKQEGPTLTVPLSWSKRTHHRRSSTVGTIICAVSSAIFAFRESTILSMTLPLQVNNDDKEENNTLRGKNGALRSQSVCSNNARSVTKNRDSTDARGLTIHTNVGDICIRFTPELAGKTSIEYITDVVQTAATTQNNGMGNNAAEMMDGRRSTEGFVCKICKWFPVVFFWMAEPLWKMCSRIIELLCFA